MEDKAPYYVEGRVTNETIIKSEAMPMFVREVIESDVPLALSELPPYQVKSGGTNNRQAQWVEKFLTVYAQTGTIISGCKAAGVSRLTVLRLKEKDPDFAMRMQVAWQDSIDNMRQEAWRRAVVGVEHNKAIYGRGKDGEQVVIATEREIKYSDTLLIFLMKAAAPETYADRQRIEHANAPTKMEVLEAMAKERGIPLEEAVKQADAFLANVKRRKELTGGV